MGAETEGTGVGVGRGEVALTPQLESLLPVLWLVLESNMGGFFPHIE